MLGLSTPAQQDSQLFSQSSDGAGAGSEPFQVQGKTAEKPGAVYAKTQGLEQLDGHVSCAMCPVPGSIVAVRTGITVVTEKPHKPRWWRRALPVPGLPRGQLMPQAAGSKPPPLFTISNPTSCFGGTDLSHLGSLAVRLPGLSRGHRSLPRAMENFYDFLTFIQLFGSKKGAGRRAQTCLCINSRDRAGGWSCWRRVPAGTLPTKLGVPAPTGTQSHPNADANILAFFKKNNNTEKIPLPSHRMAARDVLAHKQGPWGWCWPGLGPRHGSHAGTQGRAGIYG